MDAAALILRRCKVSPIRAALARHQVLQRLKGEIQSKAAKIINAYAETTIHHYAILSGEEEKKELYITGAILGARGNEKKESTTDMPKTTNLVLQDVTRLYIICFCVCWEYAVNKKEYGSLKKKKRTQLQRKFPEPVASWLQRAKLGKYGFHQHPNTSSGPDKEKLHLDPESEDSSAGIQKEGGRQSPVSQAARS